MHGHTGRFTNRHQAGHDTVRVAILLGQHFAVEIGRDAAHIVVHGRQNRNRGLVDINPREHARGFRDARQAFGEDIRAKVLKMQEDVILVRADAASLADFHRHRTGDEIARGEIFHTRRIPLHKAFAIGIGQISAFTARAFCDQAACAINTGRVELDELHILKRQSGPQHHRIAVTGAGVRGCAREEGAAIAARCENGLLGAETVECAVIELPRCHAAADAIIIHNQIKREIFDKEFRLVFDALAIKRVQHGVARAVSGSTCALHWRAFAHLGCVAAKRALIDIALFIAREGHAPMLKLVNRFGRFAAEIFDRILIAQPVRPFDRVIHVPAPVIRTHIAQ